MRNRKYDIEKYLRGELSPAEMHALEKDALSDPFLAEALEGVEQAGADNFLFDLHTINRSVHDRMRRSTEKNKNVIRMWGWMSGVAATILLIAIAGFIVVKQLTDQQAREQAMAPSSPPEGREVTSDSLSVDATDERAKSSARQEEALAPPKITTNNPSAQPQPPAARRDTAGVATREILIGRKQKPDVDATADEALAEQVAPVTSGSERASEAAIAAAEVPAETERSVAHDDRLASEGAQQRSEAKRAPSAITGAAIAAKVITGKVTDENGLDLPGVNVSVQGTSIRTVTDGEGNYQLAAAGRGDTLVFNFIGFEPKELPLPAGPELNVTLEENITALSEVVIVGYSKPEKAEEGAFRSAEPTVGTNDFKAYLANSVKYPQQAVQNKTEGKVTIRFTVEATGQLSDFEVVKGIGSGCEEELIRAIRQGPYWKPGTVGDQPVRDKVRVRYKFQLPK